MKTVRNGINAWSRAEQALTHQKTPEPETLTAEPQNPKPLKS